MRPLVIRLVKWIIRRYYFGSYRLVTPLDLEVVVSDYLTELVKLGVRLELAPKQVGESDEQLSNSCSSL